MSSIIYKGSVKNIYSTKKADEVLFEYSDQYSIFDWGEMPDHIQDKGSCLNLMGETFFKIFENALFWQNLSSNIISKNPFFSDLNYERLHKIIDSKIYHDLKTKGLSHHYIQMINPRSSLVKKVEILKPQFQENSYDYRAYKEKPTQCLVPLEVIFRFNLALGNSLSTRAIKDLSNVKPLLDYHYLPNLPCEGENLGFPLVDFSTKLERSDRYLSYSEAQTSAGLSDVEFDQLIQMTQSLALGLFFIHKLMGLELLDGKFEFAFSSSSIDDLGNREFQLVDSIGLDELRLKLNTFDFSKEFLRQHYKKSNWYQNLMKAKEYSKNHRTDFKSFCIHDLNSKPEKLPEKIKYQVEFLYKAYTNSLVKTKNSLLPLDKSSEKTGKKTSGEKTSQSPFEIDFSVENYLSYFLKRIGLD